MRLLINQRDSEIIKNSNPEFIAVRVYMKHTTNATAFTEGQGFDLSKLMLAVTYKNGKHVLPVKNSFLLQEVISAYFGKGHLKEYVIDQSGFTIGDVYVVQDTGIKEERVATFLVPLYGVLNLDGSNESIEISASLSSDAFSAQCDTSASYVDVVSVDGIGIQQGVVITEVYPITGSQAIFKKNLGNGVIGIDFVNTDATGAKYSQRIINDFSLTSSHYSVNRNYMEMLGDRSHDVEGNHTSTDFRQNFRLFKDDPIHDVTLNINLYASNNNAGKNSVVVRRLVTLDAIQHKALGIEAKIERKNQGKFRID